MAASVAVEDDAANAAARCAATAAAAVAGKARAAAAAAQTPAAAVPAETTSFKGVNSNTPLNAPKLVTAATAKTMSTSSVPFSARASVENTDNSHNSRKRPIDTSTAHIAALTSSNWSAASSVVAGGTTSKQPSSSNGTANNSVNDPNFKNNQEKCGSNNSSSRSPDERARQNRDRNREHARNTRLRKKAYVEELKRTLTELVAQRDAQDLEKRHEEQRDLEVREVRFRVMEEFLKIRAAQGDNLGGGGWGALLERWVAILEDGFVMRLPETGYRRMIHKMQMPHQNKQANSFSMPRSVSNGDHTDVVAVDNGAVTKTQEKAREGSHQVLRGASEVMEDASHFAAFLNGLGRNDGSSSRIRTMVGVPPVRFAYFCRREKFLMDGVNAVLQWTASTSGAVARVRKNTRD